MSAESWIGKNIGANSRYEITMLLGKGGMGIVYLAEDRHLDSTVVVKVPLAELLEQPEFVHRFQREVRALVDLSQPHVVRILDVGEHEGVPFAVMSYLNGGNLADRISASAGNSLSSLSHWLPQVAQSLDEIHAKGYVHRDIKPANILFDDHGNAYVSDFGVVKVTTDARQTKGLTNTGLALGTVEYMAPELLLEEPFDGRADQYALAATVYEYLAGRLPFAKSTPAAIVVEKTSQQLPALYELREEIPTAVSQCLTRAMNRSSESRFNTCSQFAESLFQAADMEINCGNSIRPEPVTKEKDDSQPTSATDRIGSRIKAGHPHVLPFGYQVANRIRKPLFGSVISMAVLLLLAFMILAHYNSNQGNAETQKDKTNGSQHVDNSSQDAGSPDAALERPSSVSSPDSEQQRQHPKIPLELTVHEGSSLGPPAGGAEITVYHVLSNGKSKSQVARGKTDSQGRASLSVIDTGGKAAGSYHVQIALGDATSEAALSGFPEVNTHVVNGPVSRPEELMTVTLECESSHRIAVLPEASIAVDIVNLGGQTISGDAWLDSISVQYLPGAVVGMTLGSDDETEDTKRRVDFFLLPLTSDDDGQTIRLDTTTWPLVFKNEKICWVGLSDAREAIESARANDDSSEARDLEKRLQSSIETLKDAYDSDELPQSCIAQINSHSKDLKLLQGFKDSGIGLMSPQDLPSGIATVIESVNPSSLAIPSSLLERTARHLTNVRTLLVMYEDKTPVPELPSLRHLAVLSGDDNATIDLSIVQNPESLQSLYIRGKRIRNVDEIKHFSNLQFLINHSETAISGSNLSRLPRLQHLRSYFPANTDLSFVENLPFLQTLAISAFSRKHDLAPLERANSLKCVALTSPNEKFENAVEYDNVSSLKRARPDIRVVPYEGICLGSWWLVPLALIAAIVALLLRRYYYIRQAESD